MYRFTDVRFRYDGPTGYIEVEKSKDGSATLRWKAYDGMTYEFGPLNSIVKSRNEKTFRDVARKAGCAVEECRKMVASSLPSL